MVDCRALRCGHSPSDFSKSIWVLLSSVVNCVETAEEYRLDFGLGLFCASDECPFVLQWVFPLTKTLGVAIFGFSLHVQWRQNMA